MPRPPSALLASLLPVDVHVAESTSEVDDGTRFDVEHEAVADAVPGRREEFFTGRALARLALAELGVAPTGIAVGPSRAPAWPKGVTGSITHCTNFRAAAVASTRDVPGLGIDAEPASPLPDDVAELVLSSSERVSVSHVAPGYDVLAFSAKESIFKALHPLTGIWLSFADARVTLRADGGFEATITNPAVRTDLRRVAGRWRMSGPLVLTTVVLPRGA